MHYNNTTSYCFVICYTYDIYFLLYYNESHQPEFEDTTELKAFCSPTLSPSRTEMKEKGFMNIKVQSKSGAEISLHGQIYTFCTIPR